MLSMSGCWFCTKWNWEQRNQPSCLSKIRSLVFVEIASFWNSELILDIPPPPSFVAITVVGVEPRTVSTAKPFNRRHDHGLCLVFIVPPLYDQSERGKR
ncbi:uncharacterized protein LOC112165503 isoform X2 [Rosa chinensis]|uniref:uncharacterized protein LOC112165503 isoform X2 n=1 Tax=Rosa chinensis TaxID=74649 RepID=UPI001AD8FC79|nr:uncharacterized protein LOC112165503 isoform X2 [Rosa chinensis]